MNEFMAQALHEYNMTLPAHFKWVTTLDGLPASHQSRIEARALELEISAALCKLEAM
jgi:hypothetical protein